MTPDVFNPWEFGLAGASLLLVGGVVYLAILIARSKWKIPREADPCINCPVKMAFDAPNSKQKLEHLMESITSLLEEVLQSNRAILKEFAEASNARVRIDTKLEMTLQQLLERVK